jgi:hypothetical protein
MNRIFHIYLICQLRPFPASYLPRGYQPSAFQTLVCIPAKCKFLFIFVSTCCKYFFLNHITVSFCFPHNSDHDQWLIKFTIKNDLHVHFCMMKFCAGECNPGTWLSLHLCMSTFIYVCILLYSEDNNMSFLYVGKRGKNLHFAGIQTKDVERKINNISLISKYHYRFPLTNFVT